jgi:MFS transporter, ACS family, tartrate transporter
MRRLMPFLFLLYIVNYIDRNNVGFAGLQMTGELHFSDVAFGLGSGIFFIGYVLLGIPGALLVEKWIARRTMAGTMLAWGSVASATGLIHNEDGAAEISLGFGSRMVKVRYSPGR